ncbi:heme-binding protein 2 [Striga asiatica]|uniref:Heme-binding protein 2 n=1 Tax=Striga asiatica TaxID=4170 RepID=A0A5A7P2I7_STRAF|nr:heme-binding protein 2 [Striga asiatica]
MGGRSSRDGSPAGEELSAMVETKPLLSQLRLSFTIRAYSTNNRRQSPPTPLADDLLRQTRPTGKAYLMSMQKFVSHSISGDENDEDSGRLFDEQLNTSLADDCEADSDYIPQVAFASIPHEKQSFQTS